MRSNPSCSLLITWDTKIHLQECSLNPNEHILYSAFLSSMVTKKLLKVSSKAFTNGKRQNNLGYHTYALFTRAAHLVGIPHMSHISAMGKCVKQNISKWSIEKQYFFI